MKRILPIFGIFLFIVSVYFINLFNKTEKKIASLDKSETKNAIIQGAPPCKWEVTKPERLMSENKTQALYINTTNPGETECESILFLRAPGFDVSPMKEAQNIKLPPSGTGSISWIISPKKVGTYEIAVTDEVDTKIFGLTVNNMFGLNALQAKILSFLGTLFGPMLTVPWWWDRLRKKQNNIASN
jgi:hypothetical protein